MERHQKSREIKIRLALTPGCEILWTASKTRRLKLSGTIGHRRSCNLWQIKCFSSPTGLRMTGKSFFCQKSFSSLEDDFLILLLQYSFCGSPKIYSYKCFGFFSGTSYNFISLILLFLSLFASLYSEFTVHIFSHLSSCYFLFSIFTFFLY